MAEHEFVVNFQPIVDLASGEVISAEALARWHHPDHGNLDPLRFLETVERSGLLPAFADAVLDQALIAAAAGARPASTCPVAVNVSPRSLLDPRFPGTVVARLRAHDMPADRLVLELTETLTISQLEVVDRVLGQLRDAGVRLALDDFGTGYSSLSVLSRIPVHELKIDREFVRTMETSRRGRGGRPVHRRPGPQPRPDRRGRGRGERAAAPGAVGAGLRRRSGPPVRPADAGRPAARRAAPRLRRPAGHARRRRCTTRAPSFASRAPAGRANAPAASGCHTCPRNSSLPTTPRPTPSHPAPLPFDLAVWQADLSD